MARQGGRRNSDKITGKGIKGMVFERRSKKSPGGGVRGTPTRRIQPIDRRSFF